MERGILRRGPGPSEGNSVLGCGEDHFNTERENQVADKIRRTRATPHLSRRQRDALSGEIGDIGWTLF